MAHDQNSTLEIADSRLQPADSVPLTKRMGCTRSIVEMRDTSIYEEGTIETGNCVHFRLDPVTPLEADGDLKIPIVPMELGLIFYLVHDVDAKRSAHKWLAYGHPSNKDLKLLKLDSFGHFIGPAVRTHTVA